jgi:hypothetical protein
MTEIKNKNYFTHDTELAIIAYNTSEDISERNKIYNTKIHHPLYKLTQNLIHTFKFYYTEETNLEDLQHEVITFLLTKLHKFDPTNGAKAYSYFGTIAKRYLIASNQKNYKKRMELLSLESLNIEQEDGEYVYGDTVDHTNKNPETILVEATEDSNAFLDAYVEHCTDRIYELFPNQEDAQVADAILNLFRKREKISIFNKKALYIYIREQVDIKTPRITKIANELRDLYKRHYIFYLENGYTDF